MPHANSHSKPRIALTLMTFWLLVGCSQGQLPALTTTYPLPEVSVGPTVVKALYSTPVAGRSSVPLTSTPFKPLTETPVPTESSPVPTTTPTTEPTITGRIQWTQAGNYSGESLTVCGPVAGTHFAEDSRGQPTFLNVGEDYPSPKRFVVLIWGDDRPNFPSAPESYYEGKNICANGEIQEYEGVFEIEIRSPVQIEIQQ